MEVPSFKLMSKRDVSKMLGISAPTLDAIINAGEIATVQIGRRVLISVGEVKRFVEDKEDESINRAFDRHPERQPASEARN